MYTIEVVWSKFHIKSNYSTTHKIRDNFLYTIFLYSANLLLLVVYVEEELFFIKITRQLALFLGYMWVIFDVSLVPVHAYSLPQYTSLRIFPLPHQPCCHLKRESQEEGTIIFAQIHMYYF
ncbi:hypothetical protein ACJX0J_033326, partial [Zea mays]